MSEAAGRGAPVEEINAVTLAVSDMDRSVAFYLALGFEPVTGGASSGLATFRAGAGFLNLQLRAGLEDQGGRWGRVILWVDDVDRMHRRARDAGMRPATDPVDAPWGERFFHLRDPDGHELSFARPIR